MVFGREQKQPINFKFLNISTPPPKATPEDNFSPLNETLSLIHDQARTQLRHANTVQKYYFDRNVTADQFAVGEVVLFYNHISHCSPKLQKHWQGPFVVVSKPVVSCVTYLLRSFESGNLGIVHRNWLERCVADRVPEQNIQLFEVDDTELPWQPVTVIPQQTSIFPIQQPVVYVQQAVLDAQALPAQPHFVPQNVRAKNAGPSGVQVVQTLEPSRPKRKIRPPQRLVDDYTTTLFAPSRGNKKCSIRILEYNCILYSYSYFFVLYSFHFFSSISDLLMFIYLFFICLFDFNNLCFFILYPPTSLVVPPARVFAPPVSPLLPPVNLYLPTIVSITY